MKLKDLSKKTAVLSKAFGIQPSALTHVLQLLEKGKIAKPEKLFKDAAPKLDVKGLVPFVYLNMGQKNYFFYGSTFPLGSEISNQLASIKKLLNKTTKEADKEDLEAQQLFLEELQKTSSKIKGYASGSIRYARTDGNTNECFMSVKTGVAVGGKTKKKSLAQDIANIGYALSAKNGQILKFEEGVEGEDDSNTESNTPDTATEPTSTVDVSTLKAQATTIKTDYKAVKDAWTSIATAATKGEKAKAALNCWKLIQGLQPKVADFIPQAGNTADLAKDLDTITKVDSILQGYAEKLKPTIDALKEKQGENKSNAALDTLSADISGKISDLLQSFGSEIDSIDGLKAKLEELTA